MSRKKLIRIAKLAMRSLFMIEKPSHHYFMQAALKQAEIALSKDEVPVGAVIVHDNKIIARAHNQTRMLQDPTAHAEMLALTQASSVLAEDGEEHRGSLEEATLYVTLEPCSMCAGALVLTRCKQLVFGTLDPKAGACQSLYRITEDPRLNHRLEVVGGVCAEEAKLLLQEFFRQKRRRV